MEGDRFNREGTRVHPWPIHADVWQKPTQHCKAVSLQLKQSVHESHGDFAEMQILTQQVQRNPGFCLSSLLPGDTDALVHRPHFVQAGSTVSEA